VPEEEDIHSM
jgi:hypothetical protein